ncbi:toll-like receptor 1 [Lampris incognitus]|uniref:toll-like receptor 1 n=1 Tax=Lampris incognitus TaxID=2546036 RepID=UPI0024B5D97A|nr:toll-like receptor 1 [Lampris incognitus]
MKSVTTYFLWLVVMLVEFKHSTSRNTDSNIDLSSKNLTSVPSDLPSTVEFLDLSCNLISQLGRNDFKNTSNLKFLNLSWNVLEEVDSETFSGTPLLQDLDLSHNKLQNLSGQQYLLHTRNLRVLNLAFNMFLTMTLGNEFSSLEKLEALVLGANNVSVGDFKNIAEVKLMTLTLCLEDEIIYEEGSLKDVQAKRLQLDLTKKKTMDCGLIGDSLLLFNEVELMRLTGGYDQLARQLSKDTKIHTSHLYLTNISVKWKELTQFVNVALRSFISHLTIADVAIFEPPFRDTVVSTTSNLTSFKARRAVVMSFFFSQEAVYNYFINMPVESMSILETSIIHMTCPKSQSPIHQLDFSNCALSDTIFSRIESQEPLECENLGNLKNLILHGNNLKNLQVLSKRVQYMSSLQYLDLSLNSLTYDMLVGCVWPPKITNMNLSSNGLTDSVFKCLPNRTKILDLQNNQVSAVPASLLKMDYLLSLDLSANRLRDLPVCDGFPSLTMLLLRANSLHAPSVHNLESCPNLKLLDASHNPFICTCALRRFRSFGINSEGKNGHTRTQLLSWPSDYYCSYPEAFRNFTLKVFWIPEVSCNAGVLAATILGPAFIVIITVVSLCHRLDVPWYMGMIWQWTRAKHRARTQQLRPEDMEGVEFHAFVSYSQHDAEWVQNSLLPNLEGPAGGLSICYHEKNFVPGKTIVENIMRCIEKSRRCVFVLSTHFVKSAWCHYELYFASHQHLARGSDSVVLVLLEPLPQYLIPSKYYQLKTMMERHTYLEWPQDRAKHRLFWANLRAALQSNLPNALVRQNEE